MTFVPEQVKALTAPLDPRHVASRKQGGSQVSYIEGWHAIAEANRIFGFDGWNRETVSIQMLGEPNVGKDKYGNEQRSEESRVGKEWGRKCRSGWSREP